MWIWHLSFLCNRLTQNAVNCAVTIYVLCGVYLCVPAHSLNPSILKDTEIKTRISHFFLPPQWQWEKRAGTLPRRALHLAHGGRTPWQSDTCKSKASFVLTQDGVILSLCINKQFQKQAWFPALCYISCWISLIVLQRQYGNIERFLAKWSLLIYALWVSSPLLV